MTEAEWLTCADPTPMLEFLRGRASERKKRFVSFGCCRAVWSMIPEQPHRVAIRVAERHTDGQATDAELGAAVSAVHRARRKRNKIDRSVYYAVRCPPGTEYGDAEAVADGVARVVATAAAPNPSPTSISYFRGDQLVNEEVPPNQDRLVWDAAYSDHKRATAVLVRDIFGNPFRPVAADPAWLTSTAVGLAAAIYAERAFDRLPILADALEDAGCDDADVLAHCRGDRAARPRLLGRGPDPRQVVGQVESSRPDFSCSPLPAGERDRG